MNLGLYIHIPFCRKKCDYCAFYSIPVAVNNNIDHDLIDLYIDALLSEIDLRYVDLRDFELDTIYFGGGTPSLLSAKQFEIILNHVGKRFKKSSSVEMTVEFNPGDFSVEKISCLQSIGVNRVVLGIQTLNKKMHDVIGRSALLCGAGILDEFMNTSGITHCADFIFNIPGQSCDDILADLRMAAGLRLEHISAYTLSIEQGTPLAGRRHLLPVMEDERDLFEKTIDFMERSGYIHYEVSNFALPSHESKHNLKYWTFMPYAGFGPGAHSFYNGERFYNISSVKEYIGSCGDVRRHDVRTKNSEIIEYILSGMRLAEGISVNDFRRKLSLDMPRDLMNRLLDMKNRDLLEIINEANDLRIKFTREGFFQMDGLIYEMTEMYL